MSSRDETMTGSEPELISGWFEAFNDRDLDGMLERFSAKIVFRPLRFPGVEHSYEGHDGIRAWFAAVTGGRHLHRIDAESFSETDDGRVLVSGAVSLAATGGIAPFSGIYVIEDGEIVAATHYFTPTAVLDRLGLI